MHNVEFYNYQDMWTLDNTPYPHVVTSEYIGCKKCGSKIKRELYHRNNCPVCGNDFRSKTTLNRIENYKQRIKEVDEQHKKEMNKLLEKSKKYRWLVKIEYHT